MKIAILTILFINTVLYIDGGDGYSVGDGESNGSQTSTGGSDATGESHVPISTSGTGDQGTLPTTPSEQEISDEKLIAEIMAQVNQDGGLSMDLLGSAMSHDMDTYGDDLFTYIKRVTETEDDDDNDDDDYGQAGPANQSPSTNNNGGQSQNIPDPSANEVTPLDVNNFVINQLSVAKKIFLNARTQMQEAEDAESKGNNVASALSPSTRLAAASVITSAKSEARKAIVDARDHYLLSIEKAKRGVTIMRALEKRFRVLAVAFAKAREFAGKAILVLKRLSHKADDDDDDNDLGSYGEDYNQGRKKFLDAAAYAKSKVARMKAVEKGFLSVTRALAKLRALAFTNVRKVRKSGIGLAQVMSMSEMAVNAAIDNAKSIISQAFITARATALAKAEMSSTIAKRAEAQARLAVQLATNALAAAKEQTEESNTSAEIDSYSDNSSPSQLANGSQEKDTSYQGSTVTSDDGLY